MATLPSKEPKRTTQQLLSLVTEYVIKLQLLRDSIFENKLRIIKATDERIRRLYISRESDYQTRVHSMVNALQDLQRSYSQLLEFSAPDAVTAVELRLRMAELDGELISTLNSLHL